MSQHLYECVECHRFGVAHYVLENGILRLLCTGCWKAWRAAGNRDT